MFYCFMSIGFQAGGFCISSSHACRPAIFICRPGRILFYYFTISFPLGSKQEVFASRAATTACRPAIFTSRTVCYFTISFPLISRQEAFAFRAATTGMSALHFHLSVGPFTILLFHFHWVPGRRFLHLEQPRLPVGPPFLSVSRAVYYFTIYYFISIEFQAGGFCIPSRHPYMSARHFHWSADRLLFYYPISIWFQAGDFCISSRHPCMSALVFASRAAKPTRPPSPSISQSLFCISDRQPCVSALVFACRPHVSRSVRALDSMWGLYGNFSTQVLCMQMQAYSNPCGVPVPRARTNSFFRALKTNPNAKYCFQKVVSLISAARSLPLPLPPRFVGRVGARTGDVQDPPQLTRIFSCQVATTFQWQEGRLTG